RLQPETTADVLLNFWRQIRERPDRSRKLSNADRRPGAPHAVGIAPDFGVPQRQLEPERYRLGVDAVRAPDHRRVPVLNRAIAHGLRQLLEILQNDVSRLAPLECLRGIDVIS